MDFSLVRGMDKTNLTFGTSVPDCTKDFCLKVLSVPQNIKRLTKIDI